MNELATPVFKDCPSCGMSWKARNSFLEDENILLVGYQVNFRQLQTGLFLFNHLTCRSTMAINVSHFSDLYHGPVFKSRMTGSDLCPEYCLHKNNLEPCPNACECAAVRELMQILKRYAVKAQ